MLLFHMQPQDQNNYGLLMLADMLRQDKEDCWGGNSVLQDCIFFLLRNAQARLETSLVQFV